MRGHIPALDGLRGVAILLVIAVHVQLAPSGDVPSALISFLQTGGWLGVDLFFVLSGFLIGGILLDLGPGTRGLGAFFVRRVLRIWPLYLLAVAVGLLLLGRFEMFAGERAIGREWQWFVFVQNLDTRPSPLALAVLWSLAVEEQMYLVLPLLVLLVPRRRLAWLLVGLIVLAPVWRLAMGGLGVPPVANYLWTPARADTFAVGVLLALWARQDGLRRLGRWPWLVGLTSGSVVLGIGVAHFNLNYLIEPMPLVGYTASALCFGATLVLALTSPLVRAVLSWSILRRLGRYSYAIYLFHWPLWLVVGPYVPRPTLGGSRWPAQLLALAVMIGLSLVGGWASWMLIERHILALKRFVPYAAVVPVGVRPPSSAWRTTAEAGG